MAGQVKPVPDGYHTVTPHLIVNDGAAALEFYKKAFGAVELFRMTRPDGRIGHAEIKIGDSPVMLADEHPEMGALSPRSVGGSPVSIYLYVANADAMFNQAVAAGAKCCAAVAESVLRRPDRGSERPFRVSVVHCHTHRRRLARRVAEARR